jgi:uncharacterized membrane protein
MASVRFQTVVIAVVFMTAGFGYGFGIYQPQLSSLKNKVVSLNYEVHDLENLVSDLQTNTTNLQELLRARSFSEIWLLGPAHQVDNYPFLPVSVGQNYSAYVEVGNHLGSPANYSVLVKFRNQTQSFPTASTPSSLPSLYSFSISVQDGGAGEAPLTFAISDATLNTTTNTTLVTKISINGVTREPDTIAKWDEERNGYYYQVIFELWIFNSTTSNYQYHDCFADLWLMLKTS